MKRESEFERKQGAGGTIWKGMEGDKGNGE